MNPKKNLLEGFVNRFEESNRGAIEPIPVEFLEVAIDIRDALCEVADQLRKIIIAIDRK